MCFIRKAPCDHITRGYFGLGDHEHVVHVRSSRDFRLSIWARNVETSRGGVQIMTPPSQFRGKWFHGTARRTGAGCSCTDRYGPRFDRGSWR